MCNELKKLTAALSAQNEIKITICSAVFAVILSTIFGCFRSRDVIMAERKRTALFYPPCISTMSTRL